MAVLFRPFVEEHYGNIIARSHSATAMVQSKEITIPWYSFLMRYRQKYYMVSYSYTVEDHHYASTVDIEYENCFNGVEQGQALPIYYEDSNPASSQPQCKLNRLANRN